MKDIHCQRNCAVNFISKHLINYYIFGSKNEELSTTITDILSHVTLSRQTDLDDFLGKNGLLQAKNCQKVSTSTNKTSEVAKCFSVIIHPNELFLKTCIHHNKVELVKCANVFS